MAKVLGNLEHKERIILTLIFLIIFGLLVFDVWEDLESGASLAHVSFETFILLLAAAGITIQWTIFFLQRHNIQKLGLNLEKVRQDLNDYKSRSKKFIEGLGSQIDQQLTSWGLSKAEKEVALLVLKGLSNKEIAEVRNTADRTVRQQMTAIFQKSNLSSRLELSAFFLEDLLVLPQEK